MINGKVAVHLYAPVLSRSGYGGHAREVLNYLLQDEKFIVFLENVNWGNCGSIHDFDLIDKEQLKKYYQCIHNYEQAQQQNVEYDLSIYLTIPNEFKRRARFCIGLTAGIEVDRCTFDWVQKCNEMDVVIVPSSFSKDVLQNTIYKAKRPDGSVTEERIRVPILVIPQHFESVASPPASKFEFSTKRNLLFVGQWGNKGSYGEDRKNVSDLIRIFLTHFGDNPDYGLILKTNIITDSPEDLYYTKDKIKQIKSNFGNIKAKIYLIHENLSDAEMYSLYSHPQITGMISLTHGEGFGRPLLEAASVGLPVLATNWSGHLDFLREKNGFLPIDFDLKEIPECQVWQGVIDKGSRWACVKEEEVRKRIKKFLESPQPIQKLAKENVSWLQENYSKKAVYSLWNKFFESLIKPIDLGDLEDIADPQIITAIRNKKMVEAEASNLKNKLKIEKGMKKNVLFIMPRSFGDIVICTSIVNSLIQSRHQDDEFYFATSKEYFDLLKGLVDKFDINLLEFDERMMNTELTREIWDYVYNPGVNVQYTFSNWTLGNGEFGVKLLEEFAKSCNLGPHEIQDFVLHLEKCSLPKKQYIAVTPVSSKQAKNYKYWDEVIFNLKNMAPDLEIVQLGMKSEKLLDGVLDYRGRSFNETMYIISRSVLHISPDTGTAHVAGALGVPHIVLFGSTSYNQCAPILLKNTTAQVVIDTSEACEPRCYKDVCSKMKDGKNCLSYISPQTIATQAFNLLSGIKDGKVHLPVLRLDKEKMDDMVDEWHEKNSGVSLEEFLSISKNHYEKYVAGNFEDINGK